jgi:hypothetical protein
VVTPGEELRRRALAPFPLAVRDLCAGARVHRFDARGGGGYYTETNDIWLAAGVETYEGRAQVALSTRHELFHYVCWNHPAYRGDEERGFPALIAALEASRTDGHARYGRWVRESFLPQRGHANVVEYFADIPTNFPDPTELPPPLAAHFAPLLVEGAAAPDLSVHARRDVSLEEFRALLAR